MARTAAVFGVGIHCCALVTGVADQEPRREHLKVGVGYFHDDSTNQKVEGCEKTCEPDARLRLSYIIQGLSGSVSIIAEAFSITVALIKSIIGAQHEFMALMIVHALEAEFALCFGSP